MDIEKYTLTYEGPNGIKITREFSAEDLHEVSYHMLNFIRSSGFDYVDMLEFSTPSGSIYRAETMQEANLNKIDKFHHHEALHAAHIATDFVSDHVLDHVWISNNPDLKEKAEDIYKCSRSRRLT